MLTGFRFNWLRYVFCTLIVSGCSDFDNGYKGDETDTSTSDESVVADVDNSSNDNPSNTVTPGDDNPSATDDTDTHGDDSPSATDDTDTPGDDSPSATDDTDTPGDDNPSATDDTDTHGNDNSTATDGTNDTEKDENDSEQFESCSDEGAYRCVEGDKTARELCVEGVWKATTSCAEGEMCDPTDSRDPGSCVPAVESCQDRPYEFVCVGSVMHECGKNGNSLSITTCEDEEHCKLGLTRRACIKCIPQNDYKCSGKALLRCDSTGMRFEVDKECQTEALCNAEAQDCTEMACSKDKFKCGEGNKLLKCNESQTAWEVSLQCKENEFCDGEHGECDECKAIGDEETMTCDDLKTLSTCSEDGKKTVEKCEKVDSKKPYCTDGECVECTVDDHCKDKAGPCVNVSCENNKCELAGISKGDPCNGDGVCDEKGEAGKCADCTNDTHCTGEAKHCLEDENKCVECAESKHCTTENEECNTNNKCDLVYKTCTHYTSKNECLAGGYGFCPAATGYCTRECSSEGGSCTPGTGSFDQYKGICLNISPKKNPTLRCYFDSNGDCPDGLSKKSYVSPAVVDKPISDHVCLP